MRQVYRSRQKYHRAINKHRQIESQTKRKTQVDITSTRTYQFDLSV